MQCYGFIADDASANNETDEQLCALNRGEK